jgi:hypothetical protein
VLEFFTSLPLDGFYLTTVTSFDPLLARRLAFVPGIHKYVLHLSVVPPSKRVASIAFLNDEDADESTGSGVGGKSLEDGKFGILFLRIF